MGYGMRLILGRIALSVLELPRPAKRGIVLVIDAFLCVMSVWLAFYLRLGFWVPLSSSLATQLFWPSLLSIVLALPIFIGSGLYRAIFRYSGFPAMLTMMRAMLFYGSLFSAIFTFWGVEGVPRTVGLIQPLLLLLLIGASRAVARIWLGDHYYQQLRKGALPKVLIYGAGTAGRQIALAMANSSEMRVIGFVDDDSRLQGNVLNGLPIYAPVDLQEVLAEVNISNVLLALPSVSRHRRNEILKMLSSHNVAVRTLPGLADIAAGRVRLNDIRDLDIDDLLGREPVAPDDLLLSLNTYKRTVLVTGAGGSIGSELCRQIIKTKPKRLLLIEMSEFALYQIHRELESFLIAEQIDANNYEKKSNDEISRGFILGKESEPQNLDVIDSEIIGTYQPEIEIVPILASVCDQARMQEIMAAYEPHSVYHAAAYKHVPLVEHNPIEGIRNNVLGTRICAEVAIRNRVQNFVLISTDKAVRPTNIMGATKRLAEMVLQAFAELNSDEIERLGGNLTSSIKPKTCFSMVRFGNVLGSSGSVVPLFREQIKGGGPITLTHADITRYFMTIPEAAQLVIQAGAIGMGGDVFVLDMGQPVKIINLARRMIELSGLTVRDELNPCGDIEIQVTGLRPGEKLYEELLIGNDPKPTQLVRIMKAYEQFLPWSELKDKLGALEIAMVDNNVPAIRSMLEDLVSGYRPDIEVVDWVYRASKLRN